MRSIKTRDLQDAMEILANAYAEWVKDSYFLGFAEEIGQADPRHREIIDLSLKVSAAMVTLRGNDKATRKKADACRNLDAPCSFRKNEKGRFVCGYSGGAAAMNCKGRKAQPPPSQCERCARLTYCKEVGRDCLKSCSDYTTEPLGWPEKIYCKECLGKFVMSGGFCSTLAVEDEPADPRCYVPAAPTDPYGGKVRDDGMIEYVAHNGDTITVDPNGTADGVSRGDKLKGRVSGNITTVVGTNKENGKTYLWLCGSHLTGIVKTYSPINETHFVISRARNPQEIRNPYMAGLAEGGVR